MPVECGEHQKSGELNVRTNNASSFRRAFFFGLDRGMLKIRRIRFKCFLLVCVDRKAEWAERNGFLSEEFNFIFLFQLAQLSP